MRSTTLLVLLGLTAASAGASAAPRVRIAVMDFTAKSGIDQSQLDVLTDVAANEIRNTRLYDVVSKSDIKAMLSLEEQKQLAGCGQDSCLAEIGGALGVDYIVTGNVGRFGEVFAVNLKLLNTHRAMVENSVFHKVPGGEMGLLEDLPLAIRELLGIGAAAAPAQGAGQPAAVVPAAPVSYDAAERELAGLGFSTPTIQRLKERRILLDFDVPRLAAKLKERGFSPEDIAGLLLDRDLLDRPLEDRLKWAMFYASGMNLRLWRHYKRSRKTLTDYYNDAQESTALEVLQWLSMSIGGVFVIGASVALSGADTSSTQTAEEREKARPAQIGMVAGGAAVFVAGVVMFAVDLLDRGQVPEGFFETATKQQILERIPEASERFERDSGRGLEVGLAPWTDGEESGGLTVMLRF